MSSSDFRARALLLPVLCLSLPAPGARASGQERPPEAFQPGALPGASVLGPTHSAGSVPFAGLQVAQVGPGRAFLSSFLVPGLGQYQQGRRRWVAYLGVEILAAYLHFDRKTDARRFRREYRDLAWEAARGGGPGEIRTDGDFIYYETLSKWSRSGAFDQEPGLPGVTPEMDPQTFNGSVWALAMEIFNLDATDPASSPGYGAAVAYYEDRAYGPEFLWDWGLSPGSQSRFTELIGESDRG
ncbi:MAG: hypothetical protein HKO53_19970, partial [Gemmatimonadetes bacterium]|nr:hypothetical protein [Gemmatimonadota bacterium]